MDALELSQLKAADLERADVRFSDGIYQYRTTGEVIGSGGMGRVWALDRWPLASPTGAPQAVVGKVYREEYIIFVREDETARRRLEHFELVLSRVRALELP